jgi:hypothetical protein
MNKNKFPRVSKDPELTRRDIYALCNHLGHKVGAEIGVRKGTNAKAMFKTIEGLKLYCVDPWMGRHRQSSEVLYERAKKQLAPYDAVFMKMTSMEAVSKIENRSLDFIYIDARHNFDNVMLDLIYWVPKVKVNGIIAGHDYEAQCGVPQAVNAYTACHGICEIFLTRDTNRSFFWVNT